MVSGGDEGRADAVVGLVSKSRALLFTVLCISGQWLNACSLPVVLLGGLCGPRTHRCLALCPPALGALQA